MKLTKQQLFTAIDAYELAIARIKDEKPTPLQLCNMLLKEHLEMGLCFFFSQRFDLYNNEVTDSLFKYLPWYKKIRVNKHYYWWPTYDFFKHSPSQTIRLLKKRLNLLNRAYDKQSNKEN